MHALTLNELTSVGKVPLSIILVHIGCRLKIEDLVLSDSGIYTCEGYNSFEQHTTTGHLDIIPGSLWIYD